MITDEQLQNSLNQEYTLGQVYSSWRSVWAPWSEDGQIPRAEHTLSYVQPFVDTNAKIIDVGCGTNPYKGYFPNLIGLDPVTSQADVRSTIEEFVTDQTFEVAFCFGSLIYGSETRIRNQIAKVVSLMESQSQIFWRLPIILSEDKFQGNNRMLFTHYKLYNVFNFTEANHSQMASDFGYVLEDFTLEPRTNMYALARWVKQ